MFVTSHASALECRLSGADRRRNSHDGSGGRPKQDDRFLALLEKGPRRRECASRHRRTSVRKLGGGMPVNGRVTQRAPRHLGRSCASALSASRRRLTRFIQCGSEVTPEPHSKMAVIANFRRDPNEPTHRVTASHAQRGQLGKRPAGVGVGHDHHVAGMNRRNAIALPQCSGGSRGDLIPNPPPIPVPPAGGRPVPAADRELTCHRDQRRRSSRRPRRWG